MGFNGNAFGVKFYYGPAGMASYINTEEGFKKALELAAKPPKPVIL